MSQTGTSSGPRSAVSGMDSAEIRRRFIDFFESRSHVLVPSAPLPLPDPTLLLVNAGMVPFKPYFLGEQTPPYARATSVQKVVRTLDIEEVGRTTRHASFFQMAGNFSFGDYFKEAAIPFAWELLTSSVDAGGYGFPAERLWATVYADDDESVQIWHRDIGMPMERIQRRGLKDNYWHMGVPGPGGPCSEIYYDRGEEFGKEGGPVVDEDRYMEVWNLVFMQDILGAVRAKDDFDLIGELPAKNIDTGMGLERMAAVLQGVGNVYEIDTTRQVIDRACELTATSYGTDLVDDVRVRVVADHVVAAVMLIGDQVTPGNEGRGYVLRRLMRRVTRSMRLLGADQPTMRELIATGIAAMGPQYPELEVDRSRIYAVAEAEEATFLSTLRTGTQIFDVAVEQTRRSGDSTLSGDDAFKLHDTYGFPIDLTLEMAAENGLQVDEVAFRRLMGEQRDRARADARAKKSGHTDLSAYRTIADVSGRTEFTGYTQTSSEATLRGLLVNDEVSPAASVGDSVEFVLDRTPFYAEGGGQLADQGQVRLANGALLEVDDVQTPLEGLIVHRGRVLDGTVETGLGALAEVDVSRRHAVSRAHTATHMVHKAMRELLGETATQAGSENAPGRFRFDFPNAGAVPPSVLADVEARVNEILLEDLDVTAEYQPIDQARASGATALFGEKYGDIVRVVSVGDWTRELCGGTHVARTGQLGVVKLLSESSIGAGVRRIEALVGNDAYRHLAREHALVNLLTEQLKVRPEELPERVADLVGRLRTAEREIEKVRRTQLATQAGSVVGDPHDVAGVAVWSFAAPADTNANELRQLVLDAKGQAGTRPGVVVGFAAADGKASVVVATTEAARSLGVGAGAVLRPLLPAVDGRGGGKDDVAQGGGTNAEGIAAALRGVDDAVRAAARA
jgi:alanyl-tRNA synthetase